MTLRPAELNRVVENSRAALVDRIASEPWRVFPNIKPHPGDVQHGAHLYLMQAGDSGPVKIGRATDPYRRARELQPGCADRIMVVSIIEGRGGDERRLHELFATHRMHGEWFAPSLEIFEWFEAQR